MSTTLSPFHIAFPVSDLESARKFYTDVLGCAEGRSSEHWVDLNLFGHQIVAHHKPADDSSVKECNDVDGKHVPIPHFGVVLPWEQWHQLSERLKLHGIEFEIEPYIRFEGEVGEQATMFFRDPSGNALEFKAFKDPAQLLPYSCSTGQQIDEKRDLQTRPANANSKRELQTFPSE